MSITKTENGTYRLRVYIPEEVKSSLGDKESDWKTVQIRVKQKKIQFRTSK